MKTKQIALLVIAAFFTIIGLSSCSGCYLEPLEWEKNEFEREVRKAVKSAVNAPGIDNGSTIIVTMSGDTLVAPQDSLLRTNPARTVYVDITSPAMPANRISRRNAEIFMIGGVIASVIVIVLIVLFGIFITIWRRQSSRNKILREAIDGNYQLPESYFTGAPSQPSIHYTVNRGSDTVFEKKTGDEAFDSTLPPAYKDNAGENAINNMVKDVTKLGSAERLRQFRNGIIFSGIGIVIFFGFCIGNAVPVGIIAGGTLLIIGLSKLITIYMSNRF